MTRRDACKSADSATTGSWPPTRCRLLDTILIQTYEPTGPFGAKAVAEIPMDGMAPAIASAIFDATGVRIREIPFTPERVWRALRDS